MAPLSPNPVGARHGGILIDAAARGSSGTQQLTARGGFAPWVAQNFAAFWPQRNDAVRAPRAAPRGPASFPNPKAIDTAIGNASHRVAARAAGDLLRAYPVEHPQSTLSDATLRQYMGAYVQGLIRLEATTLPLRLVRSRDMVPDHHLPRVLAAFGIDSSGTPDTDRRTLEQLASQTGQPHPAQLTLDIFQRLPPILRDALFEGNDPHTGRMRCAFNLVHPTLQLQGSQMADYTPLRDAHRELLQSIENTPQINSVQRSLASRAVYELEQRCDPAQNLTLQDVAHGRQGLPPVAARMLGVQGGSRAVPRGNENAEKHWAELLRWIRRQTSEQPSGGSSSQATRSAPGPTPIRRAATAAAAAARPQVQTAQGGAPDLSPQDLQRRQEFRAAWRFFQNNPDLSNADRRDLGNLMLYMDSQGISWLDVYSSNGSRDDQLSSLVNNAIAAGSVEPSIGQALQRALPRDLNLTP